MYLRLCFWTLSLAYTAFLLAHGNGGSSLGVMLIAALLGALIGFGLGGMFINRVRRRHG
jgi:hypothetical protein